MKTTQEMIEVMQASEAGKKIEHKDINSQDDPCNWDSSVYMEWNWEKFDYRIKKPEPKVIWVNEVRCGDYIHVHGSSSKQRTEILAKIDHAGEPLSPVVSVAVKYIEAEDNE